MDEIAQIAEETGLGEVIERYRQTVLLELSFAITCGALGLSGLLFGDDLGRGLGLAMLGLAGLFAVPAWMKSHRYLCLCTGGLLTTTAGTTVTRLVTWDDVAHIRVWTTRIYQLGSVDDVQRCVLELTGGTRLNLARPPYVRAEQLAATIEQRVVATLYPRREAELAETGMATFGPITVSADGVHDADRFAGWSTITRIERGRVRLRIWTDARRPVVSRRIRTIPDVAVLIRLVASARDLADGIRGGLGLRSP